jgi:hypothetical protein
MWNVGGYFLTSMASAVAVRKILRGEVQERKIMRAETAFDPQPFCNEVIAVLPDRPPDGRLVDESFEWLERLRLRHLGYGQSVQAQVG